MNKIEKLFDINIVLLSVFSSLETLRTKKNIELIYDIAPTIPRELKGDAERLQRILTQVLTFVFENSDAKEILLSLTSPEDFLYEECISFKIQETKIAKEKVLEFLETRLSKNIEILDGKIVYDKTADVYLSIPFQINELGHRRHYRLPDVAMLGKKVLLICESEKITQSIKKMFKYFLYDVDVGVDEFKSQGSNLAQYDILLIEDNLSTERFEHVIAKVQQDISLKYVLLSDSHIVEDKNSPVVSTHLIKPVTQESLFEMIVSLFQHEIKNRKIKPEGKKYIIDIDKIFQKEDNPGKGIKSGDSLKGNSFNTIIENKKDRKELVLDKEIGKENTKKMGLVYEKELKNFLDTFDRSDLYFRQIVNEKSINKIKDFCIDLEKHAKLIGAQSMLKFSDIVSLIFVYNKLDMLPIYPGRYHLELEKLLKEIKTYLNS